MKVRNNLVACIFIVFVGVSAYAQEVTPATIRETLSPGGYIATDLIVVEIPATYEISEVLAALEAIPVGCYPLEVTYFPLAAAQAANYYALIGAPADSASAGSVIGCSVEFRHKGNTMTQQSIVITIADNVPPDVWYEAEPDDENTYVLVALDNVDTNPKLYVVDRYSGAEFGPFVSGTRIMYDAPDDFYVQAVDSSGNRSARLLHHIEPE